MSSEFTGERVIPGQVDVDLWNEHFSRYAFAREFARGKRVLERAHEQAGNDQQQHGQPELSAYE